MTDWQPVWFWQHARFAVGLVATFTLTIAGALLAFAIGTALVFGWSGYAMRSGSMAPAIARGDVLLSMSPRHKADLGAGTIVVFVGSDHRTIAHRVVGRDSGGAYVTRGDANPVADSDALAPENVRGVGRLLVPYVGLPFVWWQERRIAHLGLFALVLILCAWLSRGAGTTQRRDRTRAST